MTTTTDPNPRRWCQPPAASRAWGGAPLLRHPLPQLRRAPPSPRRRARSRRGEPRPGEKIVLTSKQLADRIDRASKKNTSRSSRALAPTTRDDQGQRDEAQAAREKARRPARGSGDRAREGEPDPKERASAAESGSWNRGERDRRPGGRRGEGGGGRVLPKHWRYVKASSHPWR